MAAPNMAGVAALMKAIYPALTLEMLETLLNSGSITEDLGPAGRDDQFGNGLIDAFGAIEEAQNLAGGGPLPLTLIVKPASINFGVTSTAALTVEKAGGSQDDPLLVNTVTADAAWLHIAEDIVDADNIGTYRVTVDRNGLTIPGVYSATIAVDADDPAVNDVAVPVSMQIVAPVVGGNAGFHYVLLIDAETQAVIDQDEVPFSAGEYQYTFNFSSIHQC